MRISASWRQVGLIRGDLLMLCDVLRGDRSYLCSVVRSDILVSGSSNARDSMLLLVKFCEGCARCVAVARGNSPNEVGGTPGKSIDGGMLSADRLEDEERLRGNSVVPMWGRVQEGGWDEFQAGLLVVRRSSGAAMLGKWPRRACCL